MSGLAAARSPQARKHRDHSPVAIVRVFLRMRDLQNLNINLAVIDEHSIVLREKTECRAIW
jgi:hypothetical protein